LRKRIYNDSPPPILRFPIVRRKDFGGRYRHQHIIITQKKQEREGSFMVSDQLTD
jgi:hypothetical protein